jgi:hypothetical protein
VFSSKTIKGNSSAILDEVLPLDGPASDSVLPALTGGASVVGIARCLVRNIFYAILYQFCTESLTCSTTVAPLQFSPTAGFYSTVLSLNNHLDVAPNIQELSAQRGSSVKNKVLLFNYVLYIRDFRILVKRLRMPKA